MSVSVRWVQHGWRLSGIKIIGPNKEMVSGIRALETVPFLLVTIFLQEGVC